MRWDWSPRGWDARDGGSARHGSAQTDGISPIPASAACCRWGGALCSPALSQSGAPEMSQATGNGKRMAVWEEPRVRDSEGRPRVSQPEQTLRMDSPFLCPVAATHFCQLAGHGCVLASSPPHTAPGQGCSAAGTGRATLCSQPGSRESPAAGLPWAPAEPAAGLHWHSPTLRAPPA